MKNVIGHIETPKAPLEEGFTAVCHASPSNDMNIKSWQTYNTQQR